MFPVEVGAGFCVIAHRGASGYAPENTLPAFALAADMGAGHVELDTQLSADGTVVLCHDETLARYGHGDRRVEALAADELLTLDMGSFFSPHLYGGEKMLTLDGLLQRFGTDFTYHVELKGKAPGLAQAVAAVIDAHGLGHRCIITSFAFDQLVRMRQAAPDLPLGWLLPGIDADACGKAQDLGLFQLCPRADTVDAAQVQQARAVVDQVRAWGASGTPAEVAAKIRNAAAAGCDGITLNWPDWARNVPL